jgi:hypothetical protein
MNKTAVLVTIISILATGCTWRQAATITTHAAVYTAMAATGNAGDWNMNADLAGQAAEGIVDMSFDAANGTNCDSD